MHDPVRSWSGISRPGYAPPCLRGGRALPAAALIPADRYSSARGTVSRLVSAPAFLACFASQAWPLPAGEASSHPASRQVSLAPGSLVLPAALVVLAVVFRPGHTTPPNPQPGSRELRNSKI